MGLFLLGEVMDDVKQKAREIGMRIARLENRILEWECKKERDNDHNQKMIDLLKDALVQTQARAKEL